MKTSSLSNNNVLSTTYPILEIFSSFQGEGAWTLHPATFIRLAGCSVGCFWCDTKESWDVNAGKPLTVKEIIGTVTKMGKEIVIITGGEPLEHDLTNLTIALKNAGFKVHLETSGSSPLTGTFDWITLSPKKFKLPLPEIYPLVSELKIIVHNRHDLTFALEQASKVSADCMLFLQPQWSVRKKVLPLIVEFIQKHPEWIMSLQTHKYLNVP